MSVAVGVPLPVLLFCCGLLGILLKELLCGRSGEWV